MDLLVNIDVADLERAVAFYRDGCGLRVGRRFGASGIELLGASAPIYLLVKEEGSAAAATTEQRRSYQRHWTPVHLDFVTDNLPGALERLVAAGARVEGEVAHHVWGDLALLADPFGHGLCLIQFHGRGYDEIAEPAR